MTPLKNTVPDVHFPHRPLVADTSSLNITQKQLTMFSKRWFLTAILCSDTGVNQLRSLRWVRSAPSLSRDTGAAFPYSLPGMRSRTVAFFFNYLSLSQIAFLSRMTKGYCAWMYLLIVRQEEKQGRCRKLHSLRGGGLFSWPCVQLFLLSLYLCRGLLLSGLSALSAVLPVCRVSWLDVCLLVSYN